LLDFRSSVTFSEGLSRLIEWYGSDVDRARRLLLQDIVRNWEPAHD
jgi:hypothetical protein